MATKKYISDLTPEQEAKMPEWRDKWIAKGLSTEPADRETFEKYVMECYDAANLPRPKTIIWVSSPMVLSFAAPYAAWILNKKSSNGDAVDDAVRGAVGDAVDDAVGDAVRDAVGDAVNDAVRGAVNGAVRGAVRDAVNDAVNDAVDGAVGDAVGDAVDALTYIRNKWYYVMGGQFWVGGWYYWGSPSMVSFLREVCDLDLGEDIEKRAIAYQRTAESACWWWPHSDFVMVSERPEVIHLENGRLHNDQEMSIRWPDGWGLYTLRGERFDKNLWEKITSKTMTVEEVMQIQDSDKREIAFSMLGPDEMIKGMNAQLVHTGIKGNRLYRCDDFRGTGATEYALVMKDASTPRQFIKFVRPEYVEEKMDADYVTARHYQDAEGNSLPLEDYLLIPESNEA